MAARRPSGSYLDHCPRCGLDLVKCRVPNCPNPHKSLGLCDAHYARQTKYGDVLAWIPIGAGKGAFAGLTKK